MQRDLVSHFVAGSPARTAAAVVGVNRHSGTTTINAGAGLTQDASGTIANSSVVDNGTLLISIEI